MHHQCFKMHTLADEGAEAPQVKSIKGSLPCSKKGCAVGQLLTVLCDCKIIHVHNAGHPRQRDLSAIRDIMGNKAAGGILPLNVKLGLLLMSSLVSSRLAAHQENSREPASVGHQHEPGSMLCEIPTMSMHQR